MEREYLIKFYVRSTSEDKESVEEALNRFADSHQMIEGLNVVDRDVDLIEEWK